MTTKNLRIVWSIIDASHHYHPFLIIEFAYKKDYQKFLRLRFSIEKTVFLIKQLQGEKIIVSTEQGEYELECPTYFSEEKTTTLFWDNNAFETYEEALKRTVREIAKSFYHNFLKEKEEENLWEDIEEANQEIFDKWQEAQKKAQEVLDKLPVIKIYSMKKCQ
jgi:hypothetical protein